MITFIHICAFAGAWLLVAGPLFQAYLELRDEAEIMSRVRDIGATIEMPPPASAWWWLVPPVKYALERRRGRIARDRHVAALSAEEMRKLLAYVNRAKGWFYVASGATLIGVKETYELYEDLEHRLHEHVELHVGLYWVVVVAMLMICIGNVAVRAIRSEKMQSLVDGDD